MSLILEAPAVCKSIVSAAGKLISVFVSPLWIILSGTVKLPAIVKLPVNVAPSTALKFTISVSLAKISICPSPS